MVAEPQRLTPGSPDPLAARVRIVEETDTITALAVEGECDLTTAPVLTEIAQRVIGEGRSLVIDLSDVSFLDVAIVRALLEADAAARKRGCVLVVQLDGSSFAGRVLDITGADRTLATAPSLRAALQFVAASA
jgi:anti-anti-sigma factor